jgi:hypothetical protein
MKLMREAAETIPQTKPRLVPSAADAVYRRHADDIEMLRAKFGVTIAQRPPGADEAGGGPEAYRDVSDVIVYDEDIVDRLAMYCLRSALATPAEAG